MRSGRLTNILLLLVLIALLANLAAPVFKTKEAVAVGGNPEAIPPAVAAAEVADQLAPDRLAGQVAAALRDIAAANQQIAAAILEHSRSNDNIAYALDKVASELRSERSGE